MNPKVRFSPRERRAIVEVVGSVLLLWLVIALAFFACSAPTGPESFGPRVLSVEAQACELPQTNFTNCVRASESFDPAVELPRNVFVWLVTTYQNPVEPAWENYSLLIDGEVVGQAESRLLLMDPATRTVVGDTVTLGTVGETAPTLELQITLATGEDQRFLDPVADTSFVFPRLREPPAPDGN